MAGAARSTCASRPEREGNIAQVRQKSCCINTFTADVEIAFIAMVDAAVGAGRRLATARSRSGSLVAQVQADAATGIRNARREIHDAGRDVLKASEPIVDRIEEALVGALPAARAKAFIANLRAIVAAFEPVKNSAG